MRLQSQFKAYGYWGEVSNAFSMSCASKTTWDRAVKKSLLRLGKLENEQEDRRPICLTYQARFSDIHNSTGAWPATTGTARLETLYAFPGTAYQAVHHYDATPNTEVAYKGLLTVEANTAWALRALIGKPPKEQTIKLIQWLWGGWVFQVRNGKAELLHRAPTYTEADETTLIALQATPSLTDEQQEELDGLLASCFDVRQDVPIGDLYAAPFDVTFIPEPRGVVHVIAVGQEPIAIPMPGMIQGRTSNTLWPEGRVYVRTFGGEAAWQVGPVEFAPIGSAVFGPEPNGPYDFGAVTVQSNASKPPGTNVQFALNHDTAQFSLVVTLSSNGSNTPFLYSFSATTTPSERDGSADTYLDTANLSANPITQISYAFDGPHNTRSCTVTARNISGATLIYGGDPVTTPGYGLEGLENRTCDVLLPGPDLTLQPFITSGIIVATTLNRMRDAKAEGTAEENTNDWSSIQWDVRDGWAILNERPCRPAVIGDNVRLGRLVQRVLAQAGFTSAEWAGVSATDGPIIPAAAFGEEWREVGSEDTSLGDYLRHLMEMYGLGLYLRQEATGIWTLSEPSTESVGTWTAQSAGNPNNAGASRRVARDITYIRDACDFYNVFRVEGGTDGRGKLIQVARRLTQSIAPPQNGDDVAINAIGREKAYPTLRNSGIRTLSEANYALRSLVWLYGRPGRRVQFVTWLDTSLMPWTRFVLGDTTFEVKAVTGCDLAADSMQVVAREVG